MPDPTPTPEPTPTPTPAATWFDGLPPEDKGYITTKGWADPDPGKAAIKVVQSYREFEKFRGIPQDRILALPTDGNAEEAQAFWRKVGAPEKPEDYSFEGIDFGDEDTTKRFVDSFRSTAAKLNMPKGMAEQFAKDVFATISADGTAKEASETAAKQEDRRNLEKDWGPPEGDRFIHSMLLADKGAEKVAAQLGWGNDQIAAIRDAIKDAPLVAKLFNFIGRSLGEAGYTGGNPPTGMMTRDQAVARKFELTGIDSSGRMTGKGDKDWIARYSKGGAAEKREMADLTRILVGL